MKDNQYIILKVIKRHAIPLMLLLVAMVLFFISVFYPSHAYAQEQIARVEYFLNSVNDTEIKVITYDQDVVSNNKSSEIDLGKVDLVLTKDTYVYIDLTIENIVDQEIKLVLNLNKESLTNISVNLFVNNEYCGDLTVFEYQIRKKDIAKINIVLKIENVAQNAILSGNLNLNLIKIG